MKRVLIILCLFGLIMSSYGQNDNTIAKITSVDITDYYPTAQFGNVYRNWDEIGDYTRNEIVSFTNSSGVTHYYELIEIPDGDVEWLCAAYLAQQSGGYLVCLETEDENEFVFGLLDNDAYWYTWDASHNYVKSGPPIGGFQEYDESDESDPSTGWLWLSGNSMDYTNWCQNLDDGVLDTDPRNNDQPNDATDGNQDAMCFGELTSRVSTWGDFPIRFGDVDGGEGASYYAFVIEYETDVTGVGNTQSDASEIPTEFVLKQNYPNPLILVHRLRLTFLKAAIIL